MPKLKVIDGMEEIPIGNQPTHTYVAAIVFALNRGDQIRLSARGTNNRTMEELIHLVKSLTQFPVEEVKRFPEQESGHSVSTVVILKRKRGV